MPKRTNEFQQIIYMVNSQLADKAIVTESKMLNSVRTGAPTEVDIVIEAEVSRIRLKIGIECTAESRPATVEWVREMIGKHQDLPINKSILVSKLGYTKEALKTAKAHGFEALTLEEAEEVDWKGIINELDSLSLGSFTFKATGGIVEFNKSDLAGPDLNLKPELQVLEEGSDKPITFSEFVKGIIGNNRVVTQVSREYLKVPPKDRSNSPEFTVTMTPYKTTKIRTEEGSLCTIKCIHVNVRTVFETTPLRLKPAKILEARIAYGAAKNIFPESGAPDQNVLVTLIMSNNMNVKASLLIPKYKGACTKMFSMDVQTNVDKKKT